MGRDQAIQKLDSQAKVQRVPDLPSGKVGRRLLGCNTQDSSRSAAAAAAAFSSSFSICSSLRSITNTAFTMP